MFAEDFAVLFGEFGVAGTLSGQAVRGIYDADYEFASLGAAGMSTSAPAFTLPSGSVPAAIFEAQLVIPAGTFRVMEARPDGTGITVLMLQRG